MTLSARNIPSKASALQPTPFKLFIPKQLTPEVARPVWEALERIPNIILADPFALPGVSSIFPGVLYSETPYDLAPIVAAFQEAEDANPEDLANSWVELWVPESLEDEAAALDVQDLTQPPTE